MKSKFLLFPLAALLLAAGCKKDGEETAIPEDPAEASVQDTSLVLTEAFPGANGVVKSAYLDGELVMYTEVNNENVMEGDIIVPDSLLSPNAISTQTTGFRDRQWKNKVIPYEIAENLPDKYRVRNAIAHWEKHTPIRFVKRTNQKNYVSFVRSDGCSANLGCQGGRQFVWLAKNCLTPTVIHEIGHAVGLLHEHTRTDQEKFVKIIYSNIPDDKKHNFRKWSRWGYNGFNMGPQMDFKSVMMYHSWSFAKNPNKPTLTRLDGTTFNGGNKLSEKDIATVKKMYAKE